MTEHKFTDEEIINSLKICSNNGDCKECAINPRKGNYGYCTSLAIKQALDLINRQKEEIEDLQQKLAIAVDDAQNHTIERIRESTIRFVAVNEFAEMLKKYYRHIDKTAGALIEYTIDAKVKEFLGGIQGGAADSQDNA